MLFFRSVKKVNGIRARLKSVPRHYIEWQDKLHDQRLRPSTRARLISGSVSPQNIRFFDQILNQQHVLTRHSTHIPGKDLTQLTDYNPSQLLRALTLLEMNLMKYHGIGLVHGDVRAKNIIYDGQWCRFIDWEAFCLHRINGGNRSIGYEESYKTLINPTFNDLCEADIKALNSIKKRVAARHKTVA